MIIEFYIIMTRLYYKVNVRNEMSLFLGENQHFYEKQSIFFCNRTIKVFKIYSFYLSCFKFDAALFQPTYILSCLLIKPAKIFSFLASKTDIFIFRYNLGNVCFAIS